MKKLYNIRIAEGSSYSKSMFRRLVSYHRARRLVSFLKKRNHDVFAAAVLVNQEQP